MVLGLVTHLGERAECGLNFAQHMNQYITLDLFSNIAEEQSESTLRNDNLPLVDN